MKVSLRNGSKLYICDSCYAEVYSLLCRFINGEWYDVCTKCHDEEKVKCIYIDPPYNTGSDNGPNKGWIYNDEVKDNVE